MLTKLVLMVTQSGGESSGKKGVGGDPDEDDGLMNEGDKYYHHPCH